MLTKKNAAWMTERGNAERETRRQEQSFVLSKKKKTNDCSIITLCLLHGILEVMVTFFFCHSAQYQTDGYKSCSENRIAQTILEGADKCQRKEKFSRYGEIKSCTSTPR